MDITQEFCASCGGISQMKVNGKVVPPEQWHTHGVIGDCGCWCHVEFGNPQILTAEK